MTSDLEKLVSILRERDYDGLEMTSTALDDETHLSVVPGAFSKGIRAVFKDNSDSNTAG